MCSKQSREKPSTMGKKELIAKKLIGTWKGQDHRGKEGIMILNENKTAKFIIGNKVFGPDKRLGMGISWEIDTTYHPTRLKIIATSSYIEDDLFMAMIMRFKQNNQLQLRLSEKSIDTFPSKFTNDEKDINQMTLIRQ